METVPIRTIQPEHTSFAPTAPAEQTQINASLPRNTTAISGPVPEAMTVDNNRQSQAPAPPAVPTTLDDFISTELNIEEKRQLRFDLLSLPPEKLGEIIFILQKSQPHNIEQKGDELEIDLKKLNTKTLRHLQRYVESVFAKVRYNSTQMMPVSQFMAPPQMQQQVIASNNQSASGMDPWGSQRGSALSVNDLMATGRKRSFDQMSWGNDNGMFGRGLLHQRKKRSAFSNQQKEAMVMFWSARDWQPNADEMVLEDTAATIGITVAQLKVFRQNNRKKYNHDEGERKSGSQAARESDDVEMKTDSAAATSPVTEADGAQMPQQNVQQPMQVAE